MIPVEEAQARILAAISPLEAETVDLGAAAGRWLAEDIAALRTQPPAPLSAMDGYAVRHNDVSAAPVTLDVVAEVPAGQSHDGTLQPGQAVRIFTGATMPAGADTVVIQESTEGGGTAPVPGPVTILEAAEKGRNVRPIGLDFEKGRIIAGRGQCLGAARLGLIATAAGVSLNVFRRPRVAILATGDELVPPGVEPGPDQVVAANTTMLAAMYAREGAEIIDLGIAPDDADTLKAMAARGADADLFVTIGGASVGAYDLVQTVLAELGLELDFWKVAMRPGKPLIFGIMKSAINNAAGTVPVIGLPGNPVSAYVCSLMFVLPALRRLQGADDPLPRQIMAPLAEDLPANAERRAFLRASFVTGDDGIQRVRPHGVQDSSALLSLAQSDVLINRPPGAPPARAGDAVPVVVL